MFTPVKDKERFVSSSPLLSTFQNKSITFVTSKVGHPMLVVDNYAFHRHSNNPKSGRINWRCSRRRVKEIRCPSSCFTIEQTVSNPTPHDPKCEPMSEVALKNSQRSHTAKLSAYSTAFRAATNEEPCEDYNNESSLVEGGGDDSASALNCSRPKFRLNKRKENLPTKRDESQPDEFCAENGLTIARMISTVTQPESDEAVENGDAEYLDNELDYESDHEFDYTDNLGENSMHSSADNADHYNQDYEPLPEEPYDQGGNAEEAVCSPADDVDGLQANGNDAGASNSSVSSQSISKLATDLSDMKRKEKIYIDKLKQ